MLNDKWDERFLRIAREVATWSKDPSTKCGAVIVGKRRNIMATGFNGFARFTDDSPERYADRESKLESVLHCEENAIIDAAAPLHGASIYIMGMSCPGCVARIIQTGIATVKIAHPLEDPFYWRGEGLYERWFEHGYEQFKQAGIYLGAMELTHFDARLLMGPQHPYFEGKANVHFDQFDRHYKEKGNG